MPDAAALTIAPAADRAARDDAMTDRQLAVLGRLAEAGLEIAVALEGQAKGGPVVVEGDIALAYNRVARAVRQTIMLQSKLIEARRAWEGLRAEHKAAARGSAARLIRSVIEEDHPNDAERVERLAAEAAERLGEEDFSDLLSRPFAEAVAAICKDLGLSPDWLALAEDCAAAEAAFTDKGHQAPSPKEPEAFEVRWLDSDSS